MAPQSLRINRWNCSGGQRTKARLGMGMWESLSEFEIHFKIGHASFNVSLSPVLITSGLSTHFPSNCQCKSPVIILRFHSCRLDLNIGSNLDFPGPFSLHRPLTLLPGPQYFLDFAFSLCSDASFNVSYVISSMLFPSLYTDHFILRRE
jgi:hypothetical protein